MDVKIWLQFSLINLFFILVIIFNYMQNKEIDTLKNEVKILKINSNMHITNIADKVQWIDLTSKTKYTLMYHEKVLVGIRSDGVLVAQ